MPEWTIDTLVEHISILQAERDKRYDSRFLAQEQAILKAEQSTEKRLSGLNELRSAMSDQQLTYMTRLEAVAKLQSLEDKLNLITTRIDKSEGKGNGLQAGWGYLLGAVGGIIGIIGILGFVLTLIK